MAKLMALPIELMLHVFGYLDVAEFVALSSTHTSLCSVAQPLLYREIKGTWYYRGPPEIEGTAYSSGPPDPSIYLLLRTLVERPELGAHVEHLTFEGQPQIRYLWSETEDAISFRRDDRSPLIELMYELEASPLEEWIRLLDGGSLDVFVALLLSRLSNLKYLRLGFHFQINVPCTMAVLREGLIWFDSKDAPSKITFRQLREVSFCQDMIDRRWQRLCNLLPNGTIPSNPVHRDDLEPLLFSSAIHKLTLWLEGEPDLSWPVQRSSPSNLKILILHHSEIRENTLNSVLSQLQGLEDLEYHYHGSDKDELEQNKQFPLDCVLLSEALAQVKNTIKRVKISANSKNNFWREPRPDWRISDHLESFGEYRHLRSLTVPLVMFLGWSPVMSEAELVKALPASLEGICLTDDLFALDGWSWLLAQTEYLEHFRDYRHKWRQHAPSLRYLLKRVDCVMSSRWGHIEKLNTMNPPQYAICAATEYQEELRQLCESVNRGLPVQVIMEI
ncbi:hypothetical protein MMC34_004992 [Xylographa carneopallida]|nr:hypothetical protein [Xylographa carneopallida]